MIWHEHVSSIATAAGKSSGIYSKPGSSSHHPTFSRYTKPRQDLAWSIAHIAAAPTTLSILDAVQRRAIQTIGDPALTCLLQPLSHRLAVVDHSFFYRYSNGFCSSELTSIIPPLSKPARCTRGTSFQPRALIHQELNDTTAPLPPGCPEPGMDCLVKYLLSLQMLAYSSPASTNFP
nr:unnamed protein product [Callosobruchus chinensis]